MEAGAERDFNVRFRSCSSEALGKITEALGDDEIRMDNRFLTMDNGTHFKEGLKDESPWSTLVFTVALGAGCDISDHWHTSLTPRTMDECLTSASIASRDGATRHLLSELRAGTLPGFYHIGSKISSQDMTLQFAGAQRRARVSTDKPGDVMQFVNGDLEIQPVDIEHIDKYYFGAMPDETMYFEGGYWTSMYTAFPYECYEPDGVEAYIAESAEVQNGQNTVIIRRLESGIVPANTPVLLKCRGTSPKENRLIPVLPDDARLADAATDISGNLLTGDFGLWTDKEYNGRTKFDESTMRVFSANAAGAVGFYKLSANEDGTPQELLPNRAYLSLPLPASPAASSYRITARSIDSDLSGIRLPGNDDAFKDAPKEYFSIDGRAIGNPVKGQIYIMRQGRNVSKIVY